MLYAQVKNGMTFIYSIRLNVSFIVNAFIYLWILKCIAPYQIKYLLYCDQLIFFASERESLMGQLVKSRVICNSNHNCVLSTKRRWSWKSFCDCTYLCSYLILVPNIFDYHLTDTVSLQESMNLKMLPKMLLCKGKWEQSKQKRGIVSFLQTFKKRVHLQQHVYLRHKLKLCHVLNRCSGRQRILCLWRGYTDRMKYAESGV